MSIFRNTNHEVPGLNTASLPDLIFTVLFFFMIVTHMRETQIKVEYRVPQGTELDKLTKKSAVSYIYIGRPTAAMQSVAGKATRIQLNDKYADVSEIADYISAERARMSPEDVKKMTVSLRADKDTRMGIINNVKHALRESYALKINYSANQKDKQ